MTIEKKLHDRSDSKCELCSSKENLNIYEVPPHLNSNLDECVLICQVCSGQIENPEKLNVHHWHCLGDSMWSQVSAVQVMAWRILSQLKSEAWAQDLLDMLYLDEDVLAWAQAIGGTENEENTAKHVDSHGAKLESGDTVTLTKDLNVKGAGFTAKRGTAVRGISLVTDNPEHIEGRVNGQQIVILTKFVKKAG